MEAVILSGIQASGKSTFYKQHFGVNFNDIPLWQKRGVGIYWEAYEKPAHNPITGEEVLAQRRRLRVDYEMPMRDAYSAFIAEMIHAQRSE
jgi:tRNA(His) 5'-end guanylyltransferase